MLVLYYVHSLKMFEHLKGNSLLLYCGVHVTNGFPGLLLRDRKRMQP